MPNQRTVAVFSLPPWDFGEADMDDLVMEQSVRHPPMFSFRIIELTNAE
jgi:hypothetical protein